MKLSDETKELLTGILIVIAALVIVLIFLAIFGAFYYYLGEVILKCLNIIFNHK